MQVTGTDGDGQTFIDEIEGNCDINERTPERRSRFTRIRKVSSVYLDWTASYEETRDLLEYPYYLRTSNPGIIYAKAAISGENSGSTYFLDLVLMSFTVEKYLYHRYFCS